MFARPVPACPYAGGVRTVKLTIGWTLAVLVVLALGLGTLAIVGLNVPVPSATLTATADQQVADTASFTLPSTGAAAVAYPSIDSDSGDYTVVAEQSSDSQRSIASIAKVITALVVLDEKPIDDITSSPSVAMTQTDVQFYNSYSEQGGSVELVLEGYSFTEYELLELALIPSANNYAASLANWAFGSVTEFLNAASTWLDAHGLDSTVITDPAGLDSGTVSTASDLITLGQLAMDNDVIAGIVSQKYADVANIGTITTTNLALGSNGVVGIKTGTTYVAGYCLLFAVTSEDGSRTAIGAVIGMQSRDDLYGAVDTLSAEMQAAFHTVDVVTEGEVAATLTTEWGDNADLIFSEAISLPTVGATTVSFDVSHPEVTSLITDSTDGTATITVTDQTGSTQQTVTLTATDGITTAPISWQLQHALRWLPDDVLPFVGWR